MNNTLKTENWASHFDGKKIGKKEIQDVILKHELREVKLAALSFEDGKFRPYSQLLCNF